MEKHAIQLNEISVSHLSIVVNNPDKAPHFDGEINLVLHRGTSNFEKSDPHIAVGMRATVSPKVDVGEEPLFVIEVELSGQFTVDYSKFDFEDLDRWALVNAPSLLLPYLREHIYGLANRAGLRNMLIPLFNQPRKNSPPTAQS